MVAAALGPAWRGLRKLAWPPGGAGRGLAGGPAREAARERLRRTPPKPPPPPRAVPGVGSVVLVASGKGGVGKSTTAANLAVALAALGRRVGLLDADVFGPSVDRMMGLAGAPAVSAEKKFVPLEGHGVRCMSMGSLVARDKAAVWRGPMVTKALNDLLHGTAWAPLDVLLVDLPPGTGDVQLTITQRAVVAGAVVVSTPQDIALLDVRRSIQMLELVKCNILGVVENMAVHVCPRCGHHEHVFGSGGAAATARELGLDLLGRLPLDRAIMQRAEEGVPIVVAEPEGEAAAEYGKIARAVLQQLEEGGAAGGGRPRVLPGR